MENTRSGGGVLLGGKRGKGSGEGGGERKWENPEIKEAVRNGRNDVIILWRLPKESPLFLYLRAASAPSCKRCRSLKYKSVFYIPPPPFSQSAVHGLA